MLRGHTTKQISLTQLSTSSKLIIQVAVCIFLTQQILSYFQKTYNTFIKEPKCMNVFCDKEVCVPIIPSQKNKSSLETQDCHDIHVLYKSM